MTSFGFSKVKKLNLTGEVDKPVRFSCLFFQDLTCQKSLKLVNSDRVIQKIKGGRFWDMVQISLFTAVLISSICCLLCRVYMSSKITFCLILIAIIFSVILTFRYYVYEEDVFSSDKQLSAGTEQQNYDFLEFAANLKKTLWNTSEDSRNIISSLSDSYNVYIPIVNVPGVSCAALLSGNIQSIAGAHVQQQKWPKQTISDDIYVAAAADCAQYINQRRFTLQPLSSEEADFPLAFSIIMFRDVELFERLLRAIYRPHNFYCVHVDKKSASTVHRAVAAISSCFNNVFVAPHAADVQWGTYTVLEPELICMEALCHLAENGDTS